MPEDVGDLPKETAGHRLFLIRAECGNGPRDPEPLKAFAKRVHDVTGRDYDPTTLSLLERMKQGWRLEDISVFAAVDPLKRGPVWLSALDIEGGGSVMPDPRLDRRLTASEEDAVLTAEERRTTRAERKRRAKGKGQSDGQEPRAEEA